MTETCIYLYDDINALTMRAAAEQIRGSDADVIRVRINSDGGDVLDGMTLYTMLKNHPAKVIAEVDGFCASIASVIAMAADEIVMGPGSHMMIHNPSAGGRGEAHELRRQADNLDAMASQIADIYESRTGVGKDECLAMMADETWLTPDEAVARGFADRVADTKARKRAAARFTTERATALGYRNVPAECIARAVANTEENPMEELEAIATAAGTDAGTVAAWIAANVDKLSALVREDLDANPDAEPPVVVVEDEAPPPPADEPKPEEEDPEMAAIAARAESNAVLAGIAADLKAMRADVDAMKASAKADADARAAASKADEDKAREAFLDAEIKAGVIFATERADAKAVLETADGQARYGRMYTARAKRVPIGRSQAGNDPARDASAPEVFDLSEAEKRQQAALVRTGRYDNKSAAERLIAIRSTH